MQPKISSLKSGNQQLLRIPTTYTLKTFLPIYISLEHFSLCTHIAR